MTWSEQQRIEKAAPPYLRNVIRIITETGLRVYKELAPMKKDDVDLDHALVWIPDSKTESGVAEVPLTELAVEAVRDQRALAGDAEYLFPNADSTGFQASFRKVWGVTLRRAGELCTELTAGGVSGLFTQFEGGVNICAPHRGRFPHWENLAPEAKARLVRNLRIPVLFVASRMSYGRDE